MKGLKTARNVLLIVDDDQDVVTALRGCLADPRIRVESAYDGSDALEKA